MSNRIGIIVHQGPSGAALHTGRISRTQVTDDGQPGSRVEGRCSERTSVHAFSASDANIHLQKDGTRGLITIQRARGANGHTRRISAQPAHVGLVDPKRLNLRHVNPGRSDAESILVKGHASHLASAATAADLSINP
jgi:hypothetical protein